VLFVAPMSKVGLPLVAHPECDMTAAMWAVVVSRAREFSASLDDLVCVTYTCKVHIYEEFCVLPGHNK
jgi:hypothetical protein